MSRLIQFFLWLSGRPRSCSGEIYVGYGGTFYCQRPGGHIGWHRCGGIRWEP